MAATHDILKRLVDAHVDFVLVGGLAAVAHGSIMVTEDVDVCSPFSPSNLARIIAALDGTHPRFGKTGHAETLPSDPAKLAGFNNLYLITDVGDIDFLSTIDGVGTYEQVRCHSVEMDFESCHCRVLDLDSLIVAKRAANRPKDVQACLELEAIRARLSNRRKGESPS